VGVYANYNTPAYNTAKVKASELRQPREFMERKHGRQGRDRRTDNDGSRPYWSSSWRDEGTRLVRGSWRRSNRRHRWPFGDGPCNRRGEYWVSLNNYVNLDEREAGATPSVVARSTLTFGQVAVDERRRTAAARLAANFFSARSASSLAKFGRLPTQGCGLQPARHDRLLTRKGSSRC
jgi:hypothetical protein